MKVRLIVAAALVMFQAHSLAQSAAIAEAEAQKCEDKIASVQRDVIGKYEDGLLELQLGFQKAADLENALVVRAEKVRVTKENRLADENLVNEPKSLRALQTASLTRLKELTAQLVGETVPRLIELKKTLTMAGKLDDALAIRGAIERLQNGYVPISRVEAGAIVSADALLQAYGGDRARADKTYKGQKITVRGIFGGFRQDAKDAKLQLVFLAASAGGWVQCEFSAVDFRFREEQLFNNTIYVATPRGNESASVRWQKGQNAEITGICSGLDELVRLTKCELPR